ncbi:MAG: N-formylglutamate amidohydrolase [Thermoanaerobaculales bacterium]|nr:N-formylglutamate amidohydrolase [Thermoanaerobaculales bacterium]
MLPNQAPVPWVVIHLPHASREIPADLRQTFLVDDAALERELDRMTDHYTDALFAVSEAAVATVRFPASRLVVDPERFDDDAREPMAQRGQGVVYTLTSDGRPLRHPPTPFEREALLDRFYRPHHARLTERVTAALAVHGTALIVDAHSFPDQPLPMELDQRPGRPDICIGTDPLHTPTPLVERLVAACDALGWSVQVDAPYAGAMVPGRFLRREPRVQSVLIEVNRRLYVEDGPRGVRPAARFTAVRERVQRLVRGAVEAVEDQTRPTRSPGRLTD